MQFDSLLSAGKTESMWFCRDQLHPGELVRSLREPFQRESSALEAHFCSISSELFLIMTATVYDELIQRTKVLSIGAN